MLLVKCPHCGNEMKTNPTTKILGSKRKSCVYCGKSFTIRTHILKEL